MIKFMSTLSLK